MPSFIKYDNDHDPLHLRLIKLLNTNTSLPAVSINTFARTLTILLKSHQDDVESVHYGYSISPEELALVICKCTEKEGRYMALVEYSGTKLEVFIKGDVKDSSTNVVNGFRDQVERLLGSKVGDALIE